MKHRFLIFLLLLTGCSPDPQSPKPAIGDLTALSGKRFVAYTSPDRSEKPDTIRLSFSISGISTDRISANATLDSGASWFAVPPPIFTANAQGTVEWVPLTDTARFDYFGEKACQIRLETGNASPTVTSDTFSIIGPVPLIVLLPDTGDTFNLNDTISLHYQVNSDRISNIRTFFMTREMTDWKEITGATSRLDNTVSPFKSFITRLLPADYDTLFTNHPGSSVSFLLKDYFSPLPNSSLTLSGIVIR